MALHLGRHMATIHGRSRTPSRPTHLYSELKVKAGDPAGPLVLQGNHTSLKYRCGMIKPLQK
jgi:hypothetical protein